MAMGIAIPPGFRVAFHGRADEKSGAAPQFF
jgi:hypothetical protein